MLVIEIFYTYTQFIAMFLLIYKLAQELPELPTEVLSDIFSWSDEPNVRLVSKMFKEEVDRTYEPEYTDDTDEKLQFMSTTMMIHNWVYVKPFYDAHENSFERNGYTGWWRANSVLIKRTTKRS
jgi:hypothetical protein